MNINLSFCNLLRFRQLPPTIQLGEFRLGRAWLCLIIYILLFPKVPIHATPPPAPVDGVLTITVTEEGQLYSDYTADEIKATGATSLKIIGPVNSSDFSVMKSSLKSADSETITGLDLSEAVFTTLPAFAFEGSQLSQITLPSCLTVIENYAFGATQITGIALPSGLTTIDYCAFYDCGLLQELDLSGTRVTAISSMMCAYCYALSTVTLPSKLTTIEASAFYQCRGLASLTCDADGPLTIGSYAFYNCEALAEVSITAKGGLAIDANAFMACRVLTDVTLNARGDITLATLGSIDALQNFTLHTPGKLTAADNPLSLSYNNQMLKTLVLDARGEGSTIGTHLAYEARKLESITLPSKLASLGKAAFQGCESLTSIEIPQTVTSIDDGEQMFDGCASLTTINLKNTGITRLGYNAFYGCTSLTSVQLPEGLTALGSTAFQGCTSLTSVTIPSQITEMPYHQFYGCTSLTSITLPEGLTSIGNRVFYNCSSLQSFTVPSTVNSMGEEVFNGCSGMTTATVLASIEELPQYTFINCSSLESVELGNAIKTIGVGAFTDCTSLRDVKLPSGLTTISQYAFSHCSNLSMISLPATLTTIGQGAFINCESLVMLDVPEGITTLPREMLAYCYGLQSLYLPSTLTHMEIFALQSTDALIDVHVKATTPPTQGGGNRGGAGVTLFVPAASISAYQTADYWNEFSPIYAELTNLSTLVDDEFSMLQTLFSKTGGAQWTRPWTFGATKAETAMLEGVKISNGHIKQLVLTNNNLTGTLPQELLQFPQAWYINVSNNSFSGDVDDFFEDAAVNNVITYLDLSHNNLTGNIGTLTRTGAINTDLLPNLKTLKASHNHIRDVKPVLPDHITTLDLNGQTINDTISYRDFMETSGGNMQYFFPTLMLYSHGFAYSYDHFIMSSPNGSTPWELVFKKASHQFYGNYYTGIDAWNYDPSGRVVHLYNDRCRLNMTFDFDMGDVNYDAEFDVADLQTLINFAVNPNAYSKLSPFNWYAANTKLADQGDAEVINVQDVVCEVNLLLDEDIEPSLARAYGAYKAHETYEPQATLTIEDGQLVLTSEVPVAALDINISGDNVRWSQELSFFSRKSRGSRTIFYSLMGDVLPAGRTVLGTISDGATVTFVKLADINGTLIPAAIDSHPTGIDDVRGMKEEVRSHLYDLQGRRISSLKKGVYVINGKKVVK